MKRTVCDGLDIDKLKRLTKKELIEIIKYAYNEEGSYVIPDDKYLKYREFEIEARHSIQSIFIPQKMWADKIKESLDPLTIKTE